jgi:hypothetical protein
MGEDGLGFEVGSPCPPLYIGDWPSRLAPPPSPLGLPSPKSSGRQPKERGRKLPQSLVASL